MKAHIAMNAESGLMHTVTTTPPHEVTVAPDQVIVTVVLLEDAKTNGYYRVRIPGEPGSDVWIYKTYVRRYAGPGDRPRYIAYNLPLYQHWTDEERNCRDTREEVLVRDARGKLELPDASECKLASSRWLDLYTTDRLLDPSDVEVDHLVPLINVYIKCLRLDTKAAARICQFHERPQSPAASDEFGVSQQGGQVA